MSRSERAPRPTRCAQLVPATEGAVLAALGRPDVWVRALRSIGYRLTSEVPAAFTGEAVLVFGADRRRSVPRMIRLVIEGGRPAGIEFGDLIRARIAVHTVATGAGTLTTLDLAAVTVPLLIARARRRILRWGEQLLGMVTVTARDLPVVVGGAVVHDGRVLAARRTRPADHRGRWELPGGKVEAGETEAAAVRRELAEELGIDVTVGAALPGLSPLNGGGVLRVFRCEPGAGRPRPLGVDPAHDELRWVSALELDELDWLPADRTMLPALRSLMT